MGIEDRFFRTVVDALTHDRLTLPTLPEVAVRIGQMTREEDVSIPRLADEISKDPAIAVRLVRVANSASNAAGRRVENLRQAVTRLGLQLTRLLVGGLAMEQMFFAKSPALKERLRRSWADSVEVGALAQVLASHCTVLKPEMAMLAGLVHDIGVLPLIKLAEQRPELVDSPQALDSVIEQLKPRVGRLVLQAWHFPDELIEVPSSCHDFARQHEGPADYIDVITVALLQTHAGRDDALSRVDRKGVPAFGKLDLSPEVDVFDMDDVASEFKEQRAMLTA